MVSELPAQLEMFQLIASSTDAFRARWIEVVYTMKQDLFTAYPNLQRVKFVGSDGDDAGTDWARGSL